MEFRWRADDGTLIVVYGYSFPSSTKKKENVIEIGPSLTKLSGSAHAANGRFMHVPPQYLRSIDEQGFLNSIEILR